MNPIFAHRFEFVGRPTSRDVLFLFSATAQLDREVFATLIETEIELNLVPDEILVVVRNPSFDATLDALRNDSLHLATLGRLAGRASVSLIGYDCMGEENRRELVTGTVAQPRIELAEIRRRAVTDIFNVRHGFVESNASYHFENPSGRHTERFIRLSNILVRGAEIAFIGFCALPCIPRNTSIAYLDTPSLYAIVAAINEQRSSFAAETNHIIADNFSSYAGFDSYPFDGGERAVILISASSSGSLARRLVEEKHIEPERILHLLYLGRGDSPTRIVCDLAHDPRDNPDGILDRPTVEDAKDCSICARGSHAIKLQGDQFEFAGPQRAPLLVNKADAPTGLPRTMAHYAGAGVFQLGLGRTSSTGVRQFNISGQGLLASPRFQERLDYALRRSLPASLALVVAADNDSLALADEVASRVTPPAPVMHRDQIGEIEEGVSGAIVIVSAVIESGRTLLDISRDLRSIAPRSPLLYLIGLSKSTGDPKRDGLDRSLIQTHNHFAYQYIAVEQMILPISSDANAWNLERQLLIDPDIDALVPDDLRPRITARVGRLRLVTQPLQDELYLANGERPLRLQPGFVFWLDGLPAEGRHTEADVFFTVASALQKLRANAHRSPDRAIISNWFQQTLLAPANFGRFNDDIIQASFLRAAQPAELNFADRPEESREMGRLVRRVIEACESERGGAATEFLLALATERLRLCPQDLQVTLAANHCDMPMVKFMQAACRKRLNP